jgi:uncharacterized protein with ATP-grasp and redox domains
MRTHPECFPCFLRQTIIALDQHSVARARYEEILKAVLPVIADADTLKPPAYTTTFIHRLIRERIGGDPFKNIKLAYNNIAMDLCPQLREKIRKSADPLWTAARLAIAGNVIDFGIYTSIDIESSITRPFQRRKPFSISSTIAGKSPSTDFL